MKPAKCFEKDCKANVYECKTCGNIGCDKDGCKSQAFNGPLCLDCKLVMLKDKKNKTPLLTPLTLARFDKLKTKPDTVKPD
jgi:hypothetical protein